MSDEVQGGATLLAELRALRAELARLGRASSAGDAGSDVRDGLLERAHAVVAELDEAGRVVFVTPSIRDLLGYEPEEMLGQSSFAWLYEEDLEPVAAQFREMQASGELARAIYRARHKEGHQVWLETVAIPHAGSEGKRRTIVVSHDVGAWKRTRDALRASEERFRGLAANASDLVAEVDAEGRFLYVSQNTERVLGLAPEDVLGRTVSELGSSAVHPDDLPRMLDGFHRGPARRGGKSGRIDFRFRVADGSFRWFEATARGYRLSDGSLRVVVISRDVTARVTAEAELRESQERYRIVAETTGELVAEFDAEGRSLYMSPTLERITGYRPEELPGTSSLHLVHPDDVERAVDLFLGAVETEKPTWIAPYRFRHRDGSWRWAEATVVPYQRADGEPRVICVTRDITERVRAEQERRALEQRMQQAQRLEGLGVLAGGIAHDFNNLLTPILGDASLALGELPSDSPLHERLRRIQAAARRAAALTHQMLAYAGSGPLVTEPLDLSDLVREMAELLASAVSRNAVLYCELSPGLPPVRGDAAQLSQVVMNLLTNASEALPEGRGRVEIRTGLRRVDADAPVASVLGEALPPGRYVCLEVSDDGCGMDAETRVRIFDPFFTTKFAGRGLGLAAVLGIVRGHGGSFDIESEPGRGTRFRVLLPCAEGEALPAAPGAAGAWRGRGTVLVVDDDEGVRLLAEEVLRRAGLSVVSAAEGGEALRLFCDDAARIDAVLLDLTMPGASGEQIYDALRRARPDARVVLVSGYSEERVAEQLAGRDFAGFLQKPFEPAALVEAIRRALS